MDTSQNKKIGLAIVALIILALGGYLVYTWTKKDTKDENTNSSVTKNALTFDKAAGISFQIQQGLTSKEEHCGEFTKWIIIKDKTPKMLLYRFKNKLNETIGVMQDAEKTLKSIGYNTSLLPLEGGDLDCNGIMIPFSKETCTDDKGNKFVVTKYALENKKESQKFSIFAIDKNDDSQFHDAFKKTLKLGKDIQP